VGLEILGVGTLIGGVGLAFAWSAHRIEASASGMGQAATSRFNSQIRSRDVVAGAFLGVAAVSILTGAAVVLWPESHHVSVAVSPSGGGLLAFGGAM
jgi:hypothetical protein